MDRQGKIDSVVLVLTPTVLRLHTSCVCLQLLCAIQNILKIYLLQNIVPCLSFLLDLSSFMDRIFFQVHFLLCLTIFALIFVTMAVDVASVVRSHRQVCSKAVNIADTSNYTPLIPSRHIQLYTPYTKQTHPTVYPLHQADTSNYTPLIPSRHIQLYTPYTKQTHPTVYPLHQADTSNCIPLIPSRHIQLYTPYTKQTHPTVHPLHQPMSNLSSHPFLCFPKGVVISENWSFTKVLHS